MRSFWAKARAVALIAIGALVTLNIANAADPIRIGMSMALTGGVAPIGKQVLTALQIWRDDVNAKGGLLGRPVELVFYDDQSNPANMPQPLHQADRRRQSRSGDRAVRRPIWWRPPFRS